MFTEVEIASEAYIYSISILETMLVLFHNNVWPHSSTYFPINAFKTLNQTFDWTTTANDPALEVLYSPACIDLKKHPIVLNIPDIPNTVCALMRWSYNIKEAGFNTVACILSRAYKLLYVLPLLPLCIAAIEGLHCHGNGCHILESEHTYQISPPFPLCFFGSVCHGKVGCIHSLDWTGLLD